LHFQLQRLIIDARQDSNLKLLSTMHQFFTCLTTAKKSELHYFVDRLLCLIIDSSNFYS